MASSHAFGSLDVPMNRQGFLDDRPIVIEDDVWVGAGPTLFLQWGDWVTSLCLGLTLILVVISWYRPLQRLGTALTPKG